MSVGEECSTFGETIDIVRLCLRMPFHPTDPVIQIVNGDEEHIGLAGEAVY